MAGDGTTTATILAQAMIAEGIKLVSAGVSPMEIRVDMERKMKEIVEKLKKMSKSISTKEEITQVASITANDKEIGKIIAEAMEKWVRTELLPLKKANLSALKKKLWKVCNSIKAMFRLI